jgi:hypothetical protein
MHSVNKPGLLDDSVSIPGMFPPAPHPYQITYIRDSFIGTHPVPALTMKALYAVHNLNNNNNTLRIKIIILYCTLFL